MLSGALRSFRKSSDLAETLHVADHGSISAGGTGEWAHNKCVPCRMTCTQLLSAAHTIRQVLTPLSLLGNNRLTTSKAFSFRMTTSLVHMSCRHGLMAAKCWAALQTVLPMCSKPKEGSMPRLKPTTSHLTDYSADVASVQLSS